jgi:hypothetical protein
MYVMYSSHSAPNVTLMGERFTSGSSPARIASSLACAIPAVR